VYFGELTFGDHDDRAVNAPAQVRCRRRGLFGSAAGVAAARRPRRRAWPLDLCTETDPAYLASGALTYVIQQISSTGAASASLVWWLAGYRSILLSLPGVASQLYPVTSLGLYDMTAQGQAIWVSGPAQPKGPWTIWRWSGGAPVKITTLPPLGISPYYGVLGIAW
jgi:hypothetical protein